RLAAEPDQRLARLQERRDIGVVRLQGDQLLEHRHRRLVVALAGVLHRQPVAQEGVAGVLGQEGLDLLHPRGLRHRVALGGSASRSAYPARPRRTTVTTRSPRPTRPTGAPRVPRPPGTTPPPTGPRAGPRQTAVRGGFAPRPNEIR